MKSYKMLINHKWVDASNKETIEVLNPSNEEVIATVPMGTKEDAQAALISAKVASKGFARLSAIKRADYLIEIADRLLEEQEAFAKLLTTEQGKLYSDALGEVKGTADFFRYAAESARRLEGEILESDFDNEQIYINRVPFGVTVGLLTWNFPLALAGRKLGNALVTGNTMVVVPPLHAPLAVLKLGEILVDVLPQGVVSIITGAGHVIGEELVKNPITSLVSLTGSTEIGKIVAKNAADNMAVLSLELGGKSPFIVMDDADIEKAVEAALVSAYGNCGQICTSNERMYIHQAVYDQFMAAFVDKAKALKVGDPFEEGTDIGPKMNSNELAKITGMVERASQAGAKVILGGKPLTEGAFGKGYWFPPTVITEVTNDMEIIQEETFGPIVAAMKVKDFDEALEKANDCDYGLSGYLFTNNNRHIMRATRELEVGELYVNRRNGELLNGYHSGMKLSGLGGEDGKHGLDLYSQKKTVYVNYN